MRSLLLEHTLALIRLEYHEWPALKLTFWQAQRLWNLPDDLCERALASLVRDEFLLVTASGTFVRRTEWSETGADARWRWPAEDREAGRLSPPARYGAGTAVRFAGTICGWNANTSRVRPSINTFTHCTSLLPFAALSPNVSTRVKFPSRRPRRS
jgi:hypothetical protein